MSKHAKNDLQTLQLTVEGGRTICMNGKPLFRLNGESMRCLELDAMAHYIASKLNLSEFQEFLHEYKESDN